MNPLAVEAALPSRRLLRRPTTGSTVAQQTTLSLDPSKPSAEVTREVATYLANLAKMLESKGHAQETVAKFLMRCLFTMFAEDVGLLPAEAFTKALGTCAASASRPTCRSGRPLEDLRTGQVVCSVEVPGA